MKIVNNFDYIQIRNGRLAMWAAAGILFQESVNGGSALAGGF